MTRRHLAFTACAAFLAVANGYAQNAALGENEFYTQVNLWCEDGKPIPSTNYHKGDLVPLGSRVSLVSTKAKEVKFMSNGTLFTIQINAKHTKVGVEDFKARMFKKTDPLASAAFKALAKEQQDAVKGGSVVAGMAKAAVLMAYGYPPEHETPSTEGNLWKYWRDRFVTQSVTFTDGKVSATAGM